MHHYVYQIISLSPDENGVLKIYSGLRSCECEPEKDDYMGSGIAIRGAIEKYGREKFMKLIIAKFSTREEAHDCETQWLSKQFDFHGRDWNRFRKFHYNLRMNEGSHDGFACSPETREKMSEARIGKYGGEDHPLFGKQRSDETKKKISEANSGRQFSEETKKKMSEARTGAKNPMFGKQRSDETKKKISEGRIGKYDGENHPQFKGLTVGVNKDAQTIVFSGGKDMKSREFIQSHISQVILGNRSHHKGFHFIRTADPVQLKELLNTATFYDDVSRRRIEEFLSQ